MPLACWTNMLSFRLNIAKRCPYIIKITHFDTPPYIKIIAIMNFLRKILLTAVLLMALSASAASPKYIFFFIGDGMGMGPVMATQTYQRLVKGKTGVNDQLVMSQFPHAGLVTTYSASSHVTDSSAAGTALATGNKTRNYMLGMNADTFAVSSIAHELKDLGWGIGIVTDCAADDATPGAFYAHQPSRKMYYEIGKDAAYSGFDFIAGAGLRGGKDKDGKANDLYDVLEQQGYQILRGQDGARAVETSKSEKIMLLNPEGYHIPSAMGYAVDSVGKDGIGLTLPIAMEACLTQLQRNSPDKFFMMVENGLIDHALHANDGGAAVKQILALDECVAIAYDFYRQHPDETLIIITADHDTGAMSVGCKASKYVVHPEYVDYQSISKDMFNREIQAMLKSRRRYEWPEMKELLSERLGLFTKIKITEDAEMKLKKTFEETFHEGKVNDEKGLYNTSNAFTVAAMRAYNNASGWGFTTLNHSGNPVPIYAIGVGAENFARQLDNTQIPQILRRLTGEK